MNFSIVRSILTAGVLTALTAATAATSFAQTSNNLTGCLSPGGALTKIAIGDFPANACSLQEKQVTLSGVNPFGTNGAFYIALNRETERVIATNGSLKLTAKCTTLDPAFPNEIVLTLTASSTADGWNVQGADFGGDFGIIPANVSIDVASYTPAWGPSPRAFFSPLSMLQGASFLGLNQLVLVTSFFGRDCIVIGTITTAQRVP